MKLSQVKAAAIAALAANVPVCLEGPPGVGKSEIVAQLQQEIYPQGWLRVFNPALHDPTDIVGMPWLQDGQSVYGRPSLLPPEDAGPGIFFMDEVGQAPALMQAACMKITLENIAGTHKLPAECRRVLATNRTEDRAGVTRLLTPLANRVCRIQVEADSEEWILWAEKNGIDPRVIAFIRFRPNLIHDFDPRADQGSFPTPRSWAMTSKVLATNPHDSLIFPLVSGCVGAGAAGEFKGFLNVWGRLPDIKDVIANPDSFPLPNNQEPGLVFALCEQIKEACKSRDKAIVDAGLRVAMRLPDEFGGLAAKLIVSAGTPAVAGSTPTFPKIVQRYQKILAAA